MASKPLEPGDPLRLGRFEILGRLGEGGQGVVYLGRGDRPGEDRVAIKVLRSSVDPTVLERLARELEAVHQVQPFVTARVIEGAAEGDRRYVVSEFIDGPSLAERVAAGGPLPEGDLLRLAVGTATALTAIHGAGVVHRDFKPANVLLGPDGPRVVDFGIARLTDAATITSGVIGTPSYIAPEQLAGERPGSAVDIFAWAVTMAFAATGRQAFGADTVPAVMQRILHAAPDLAGVPPSLLPILSQCLDKDPARRPGARDLLLRLVDPSVATPALTRLDPVVTVGVGQRHVRWRPILVAITAAAAVVAVAVVLLTQRSPGNPVITTGTTSSAGAGPTIPAAYAGTWSGTASQSYIGVSGVSLPNHVVLTLRTGGRTVQENNDSCVNTLTVTSESPVTLTLSEPTVPGQCVAGTVTLTRHGSDLAYRWTDNVEQNVGNLRKTG
ncbi:MAG: serine/threonine protein kinase [Streptosporangiaceae bacterium]|nr:serine/threonine protein kinase [Streptosporangiaceae bacterium]